MKDNNQKALLGLGLLFIGGQGAYMYKQSGNISHLSDQMEVASTERTKILSELDKNRVSNDSIVSINSGLTESLIVDDKKIKSLTAELKIAKIKLHNLQKAYNTLKAKSDAIAQNARENAPMPASNSTAASDLAKRREALKEKRDSIERARMEAIAARRIQEEKNRLDAIAAKKSEAERIMADKQAAERNRLEALASKKNDAERTAAEKASAERSRLEALATQKNEAEKNRLEALAAKKSEADRAAAERAAAERSRLEALAAQKNNVEKQPVVAPKEATTEKSRIEAMIEKKRAEMAKARQAIADKNKADELAIANRSKGIETPTAPEKKVTTPANNTTADDVDKRSTTPSRVIANQNPQIADKLTKIKIVGLNASTFRYANEDTKEEEETDDSSEVGFVKVGFTIPQNFVVRASDRNYYVQILDENNNLVGDNATEMVDGEKITYCYRTNIKYKNRAVKFSDNIFVKNLKEGTYTVKVLDRKDVVSQTKIVLN
jgi:hypothetical protein